MVKDMSKSYVTSNPVKSQWHERFMSGTHKRMGDLVKQDEAISVEQMLALMEMFERDCDKVMKDKHRVDNQVREVLFAALFLVLTFRGVLRGEEVPLTDLEATKEFTSCGLDHPDESKRHGVIASHGRFKNELGENFHLMPVVRVTNSGSMPAKWMQRVLDWHGEMGVTRGPVIQNNNGVGARQTQLSFSVWSRLVKVSEEQPSLFPDKRVDILADHSTRRSLGRGAATWAEILELSDAVTNLDNRWRSVEQAKGKNLPL
jgi:hypothetical protein